MKAMIFSGMALAVLSVAGCAKLPGAMYPALAPGTPSATITIAKSPYLSFGGDSVGLYSFDNDICEDTDGSGYLGGLSWDTPNTKSTEVRADARIVIQALAIRGQPTAGGSELINCTNLIAMTPEAGRSYTMRQILYPQQESCSVEVVDDQSGTPPPSLERLPINDSCKTLVLRMREE